jgi:hypothetical protein
MSQHQARQHGCCVSGRRDRHRRPDAGTPQSLAIATGGRRGLEAESRGERTSPEPGHLMWEASSRWRRQSATGTLAADEGGAPGRRRFAKGDAALTRGRLAGHDPGRTPTEARRRSEAKEVSYRHELNIP